MNYMGAKALTHNAAPRLSIVLVELCSNLLCDDAFLKELFKVLQDGLLGEFQLVIWHVLVQDVQL